jgi:hypothetical protein
MKPGAGPPSKNEIERQPEGREALRSYAVFIR